MHALPTVLAALALLAGLPALANGLSLAPSPVLGCLQSTTGAPGERGAPEYPARQWNRGEAGRVLVELIFTGADLRPEVKVLTSEGADEFVDAVKAHARALRTPCLNPADIPARLRLDFVFKPTERTGSAPQPTDPDADARARQVQCIVPNPASPPDYPMAARRYEVQGRLLVQARFVSADGPPEVTVLSRPASEVFFDTARSWAQTFRMPCFEGRPVQTEYLMIYRLEGAGSFGFRPLTLQQFLGNVRGIQQQRVLFDFNTMGCPFALRLQYLQPLARNQVVEASLPNPLRRPFMQWLEAATLDLNERANDAVFGDSVALTIPCLRLDLQPTPPQEKS